MPLRDWLMRPVSETDAPPPQILPHALLRIFILVHPPLGYHALPVDKVKEVHLFSHGVIKLKLALECFFFFHIFLLLSAASDVGRSRFRACNLGLQPRGVPLYRILNCWGREDSHPNPTQWRSTHFPRAAGLYPPGDQTHTLDSLSAYRTPP